MRRNWAVAAILVVAAAARFWGIHFGLPYLDARPDEGAIVSNAGGMYNGDLNPHFFNYPALFMLTVAAGVYVVSVISNLTQWLPLRWMDLSDPTMPFRLARYLSAVAGIASVFVLFRIGRRLFGDAAGLAAAALLALAFLHARDSHCGVTDVPMTFLPPARQLGRWERRESTCSCSITTGASRSSSAPRCVQACGRMS